MSGGDCQRLYLYGEHVMVCCGVGPSTEVTYEDHRDTFVKEDPGMEEVVVPHNPSLTYLLGSVGVAQLEEDTD